MRLTTFVRFGRCSLLLVLLAGMSKPGLGQAQTVGKWSTLSYTMPINPIHVALLHNGKILVVAGSGNCPSTLAGCPSGSPYGPANNSGALLLDPTNGNITQFNVSWDMFCNGMVVLADGRAFINGGTQAYDPFLGSLKSSIFDPATNTFGDAQNMAHGRWYPTVLTLSDGRIMTFSGFLETAGTNTTVEFYTIGSGWSQPYTAPFTPDLYPRLHLLPNGKVFYSGPSPVSQLFDPSTRTWTLNVASTNYGGTRSYGSSVLLGLTPANNYDPVILIMGGNSPATATTETIDMGSSNPAWHSGPNMSQARIEMNAVILPNGKVLAVGGSVNDEDATTESLNADLYDPATNTFSSAGANSFARLYHSVALLLPDATVWVAGGNPGRGTYDPHIEIYQPAYLFQSDGTLAARPSITSVPSSISFGNQFTVQTPDAAAIASAILIRNGTVTHSFGMDQRMVGMSFTAGSGSLTVTAPPNGDIAPPGYYMLFILNSNGVPSVASSVLLGNSSSAPAPTVTSISPNSGTINGGTGVSITGTGFLAGATVSLGGTAATGVTVVSSTSITATTPAHAAGTVDVVVTNSDTQRGTLTQGFTYTAASNPAPMLTGISPSSGTAAGGTAVTITGTGFLAGAAVSLGGTPATGVTVVSSTSITATTAVHGAGAVDVVVTNSDTQAGTLTQGFTYTTVSNPAPTVTSISPNSGTINGGTAVTITGTGFQAGAAVSLGGTPATGVTVASSTSITATTPAHAAGAVNVVVSNAEQQSGTLANGYTYTAITPGLGLSVPAGDSSSATIVAGQSASYTLSIGGAGLSGTASLSCTGSPMGANCLAPASEPFSSTVPATFKLSVTTTSRTVGALRLPAFAPVAGLWIFALLGIVVHPGKPIPRRSPRRYFLFTTLTLLLFLCSCGSGSSTGSPQPNPNGTPAGTYTLNVKATSNATTQTTSLTLIVQ